MVSFVCKQMSLSKTKFFLVFYLVMDDTSNDEDEDDGEDAGFRADNCQDNPTSAQRLHVQEHRKRGIFCN